MARGQAGLRAAPLRVYVYALLGLVARVSFFFISVWAIIMTRVLFSILVSAALAVVLLVQRSSDPHSAVLVQVR